MSAPKPNEPIFIENLTVIVRDNGFKYCGECDKLITSSETHVEEIQVELDSPLTGIHKTTEIIFHPCMHAFREFR